MFLAENRYEGISNIEPPKEEEAVYLNIYNITKINKFVGLLGIGFFHSGVEVYGKEYWYGGSQSRCSGIVQCKPLALIRPNSSITLKEKIFVGTTKINQQELAGLKKVLDAQWIGIDYEPFTHNCNKFSQELIYRLCGYHYFPR